MACKPPVRAEVRVTVWHADFFLHVVTQALACIKNFQTFSTNYPLFIYGFSLKSIKSAIIFPSNVKNAVIIKVPIIMG